MKFTLFALFFAFFLLSVNAGTSAKWQLDVVPGETEVEIEEQTLWMLTAVGKAISISFRTLKGFNCIIDWVLGIKEYSDQYIQDMAACGAPPSKAATDMINANLAIVNTCNDIIHLETNVCGDTSNPSHSCAAKTMKKIWSLYKQVKHVVVLAVKMPKTGTTGYLCVSEATDKLVGYLDTYLATISKCAQSSSASPTN